MEQARTKNYTENGKQWWIKELKTRSLCSVDYKIIMKALSNRQNQVMASVTSVELSFCIPTRCIHDNILVAKFLYNYSKVQNTPLGIIAIDRISNAYLFKVLKAIWIWRQIRTNNQERLQTSSGDNEKPWKLTFAHSTENRLSDIRQLICNLFWRASA